MRMAHLYALQIQLYNLSMCIGKRTMVVLSLETMFTEHSRFLFLSEGQLTSYYLHVRVLQAQNIDTLCSAPLKLAEVHHPQLVPECQKFLETHKQSLTLFARCHHIYDKNILTGDDITTLGMLQNMYYTQCIQHSFFQKTISDLMRYYRETFPTATITVKLHMLEDHMMPFLKLWKGVGFGLMGEQGAESIHADLNNLKRMPDSVERLRCTIKEHPLRCC